MPVALILPQYFFWHYTKGLLELLKIWWNILYFLFHYFSIPQLLKTLFSPWRRMSERFGGSIKIEVVFETLVFNLVIRAIGLIIRSVTLVIGVAVLVLAIVFGFAIIVFWILLPAAIILLIIAAVKLIFGI